MGELKPCPFCGGEARITKLNQKGFKGEFQVFVKCSKCGCKTDTIYPVPHYSYLAREKNVVEAWNRRTNP